MTFLYTARRSFDTTRHKNGLSWATYIERSKLTHLTEVVSLDLLINGNLEAPDYANADDWAFIHTDGVYQTNFFTSLDYVLRKMEPTEKFNLLGVVVEPLQDCKNVKPEGFEFVGYDLLDKEYGTSALTNCGGFDETFLPADLNQSGLLDDYEKASAVKKRLPENNPDENHADTNVIAVWRHKTIGR